MGLVYLLVSSLFLSPLPHKTNVNCSNSLPTLPTKAPIHRIPTERLIILIHLQRSITIINLHFLGLDEEVRGYVGASDFAAVGAVAEVAAAFGEELGVGDCYGYAFAETGAG